MTIALIHHRDPGQEIVRIVEQISDESPIIGTFEDVHQHPLVHTIDLIILDVESAQDLTKVCRKIRESYLVSKIPYLVHAPKTLDTLHTAFAFGAVDFVATPSVEAEILLRIRNALLIQTKWQSNADALKSLSIQLQHHTHLAEYLREQSLKDGLTKVYNRRAFDEYLETYWKVCARTSEPLSLILIDIDFFKPYNDTYGHQAGDQALKQVSEAITSAVHRPLDNVARYGGEEFAVILPSTPPKGAEVVAEAIKNAVEKLGITHEGSKVANFVTVSQGIATLVPNAKLERAKLIDAADQGLYRAKETRNTIQWNPSNFGILPA